MADITPAVLLTESPTNNNWKLNYWAVWCYWNNADGLWRTPASRKWCCFEKHVSECGCCTQYKKRDAWKVRSCSCLCSTGAPFHCWGSGFQVSHSVCSLLRFLSKVWFFLFFSLHPWRSKLSVSRWNLPLLISPYFAQPFVFRNLSLAPMISNNSHHGGGRLSYAKSFLVHTQWEVVQQYINNPC